jgi:hypothetical protein
MLSSGQEWARPRNAFGDDAAVNFRLQCGNLTMQVVVLTREQTDVQESLRLRQLMPADSAHTRRADSSPELPGSLHAVSRNQKEFPQNV